MANLVNDSVYVQEKSTALCTFVPVAPDYYFCILKERLKTLYCIRHSGGYTFSQHLSQMIEQILTFTVLFLSIHFPPLLKDFSPTKILSLASPLLPPPPPPHHACTPLIRTVFLFGLSSSRDFQRKRNISILRNRWKICY